MGCWHMAIFHLCYNLCFPIVSSVPGSPLSRSFTLLLESVFSWKLPSGSLQPTVLPHQPICLSSNLLPSSQTPLHFCCSFSKEHHVPSYWKSASRGIPIPRTPGNLPWSSGQNEVLSHLNSQDTCFHSPSTGVNHWTMLPKLSCAFKSPGCLIKMKIQTQ